jgi:hypothetical protein
MPVMSQRQLSTPRSVARYSSPMAAAALAFSLMACTSQLDMADSEPQRATPSYPAVHDMPVPRDTKPMSAEERQRIAEELAAARERMESETTGTVPGRTPPNSR